MLAANAVTRPYANIAHDTRLYSIQVVNQVENGAFNDDLFFRYGSQDSFSLFSRLMAPLVKVLGLEIAFFLVYLAGTTLLIVAMMRIVRRLIADRMVALLALLCMAVVPLEFGGQGTLRVNETFLTPRLLSMGLALLGLDYLLQARYGPSLLLSIAAGLLHPLMAVGGFLVWGGVLLVDKLGWRRASLIVACLGVGLAALLAMPSLAGRVFGIMDDDWRETVRRGSPFPFPSEWETRDWINTMLCLLAAAGGIAYFFKSDPWRAQFFAVVLLVGIAAVLGNALVFNLNYALLIQGQPFRSLWISKVFEIPLIFLVAARLWRSGLFAQQTFALVLLALLFGCCTSHPWERYLILIVLPSCMVYFRGLAAAPRTPGWALKSVALSLVIGQLGWNLCREYLYVLVTEQLLKNLDVFDLVRIHIDVFGTIPWMMVFLVLLVGLTRPGREKSLGLASAAVFLGVQLFFFIVPGTAYVREHACCYLPDIQYARNYLQTRPTQAGKLPTVYSAYGKIEYVWLEFKTDNYFDWWEAGGFVFQRQMAMEGQRRALVIAPFELSRFRGFQELLHDRSKFEIQRFFKRDLDSPEPTLDDLARLCREPELDFAVLKHKFGDLYAATNGSVFIYDCRQVRNQLADSRRAEPREGPDYACHPAPHGARLAAASSPSNKETSP